jgi:hypothetical protein
MPALQLSAEEAGALHEVLTEYLSDLRMEIADTDSFELRETLKGTERLLKRLLGDLAAAP